MMKEWDWFFFVCGFSNYILIFSSGYMLLNAEFNSLFVFLGECGNWKYA
jgi:hypothetical protein